MSYYICRYCKSSIPCDPGEEWKSCCSGCFAKNEAAYKKHLEQENYNLKLWYDYLLMRLADAEAAKAQILSEFNELLKKQLPIS